MTGLEANPTPRRGSFACRDEVDGEERQESEPGLDDAESYEEEEKAEDWDGEADLGDMGDLPFARL